MSSAENRGQFVWHELMTTDTVGASAFYPRIAGWKTQPWELDSSYTLWVGNAGPMGGVMSLPQETPASSHWMPYIGTNDVAATVAAARALGATVCKDTTQLANGSSIAVLQDPQGAVFAVHGAGSGENGSAGAGSEFSWHELSTSDIEAALRFYMELFGWERAEKHDMGEIGFYQLVSHGGRNIGGIFTMQPGITTPHWLSYLRVSDVDQAADAAKAAGGRVVNGPMEVPGGDWIAQIIDPQGAAFAVHEVTSAKAPKAAKPAKAAKVKAAPKPKPAAVEAEAKSSAPAREPAKKAAAKPAAAAATATTAAKPARAASARRPAARKKAAAKAKSARRRASARAASAAKSRRARKVARPAVKKASARRKPAARRLAKRRSARRTVRAKRRR